MLLNTDSPFQAMSCDRCQPHQSGRPSGETSPSCAWFVLFRMSSPCSADPRHECCSKDRRWNKWLVRQQKCQFGGSLDSYSNEGLMRRLELKNLSMSSSYRYLWSDNPMESSCSSQLGAINNSGRGWIH
jgi:hypothetical protein